MICSSEFIVCIFCEYASIQKTCDKRNKNASSCSDLSVGTKLVITMILIQSRWSPLWVEFWFVLWYIETWCLVLGGVGSNTQKDATSTSVEMLYKRDFGSVIAFSPISVTWTVRQSLQSPRSTRLISYTALLSSSIVWVVRFIIEETTLSPKCELFTLVKLWVAEDRREVEKWFQAKEKRFLAQDTDVKWVFLNACVNHRGLKSGGGVLLSKQLNSFTADHWQGLIILVYVSAFENWKEVKTWFLSQGVSSVLCCLLPRWKRNLAWIVNWENTQMSFPVGVTCSLWCVLDSSDDARCEFLARRNCIYISVEKILE